MGYIYVQSYSGALAARYCILTWEAFRARDQMLATPLIAASSGFRPVSGFRFRRILNPLPFFLLGEVSDFTPSFSPPPSFEPSSIVSKAGDRDLARFRERDPERGNGKLGKILESLASVLLICSRTAGGSDLVVVEGGGDEYSEPSNDWISSTRRTNLFVF
jgi:hypothetical protein